MLNYKITTSKAQWEMIKSNMGLEYSEIPNTAPGYEKTRCYMTENTYLHKYFISANNEKDFFINYDGIGDAHNGRFSAWFTIDGDTVTISKATNEGRTYTAERFLKRFQQIVYIAACAIRYDKAVEYVPFRPNRVFTLSEWYKSRSAIECNSAAQKANAKSLGFKVFDAISGDDITETLDLDEWNNVIVDAVEHTPEYVAVYVGV